MTVVLTGGDLTIRDVVAVARRGEDVRLSPAAVERMRATRRVVERTLARGEEVYGLSTGLGVLKRDPAPADAADFNRRLISMHRVGQGPEAPLDVVRAALLRLINAFAAGWTGVRPELAEHLVRALNDGPPPAVRVLGSVGQSDLAAMADLADGVLGDFELAAGEGLALVNSGAFSTGWAALAMADARQLLDAMEAAGALSLEGLAANLTTLHPAVAASRPYPGVIAAVSRLRALLDGSALWRPGAARSLQDPLTFRNLPQLFGAVRDAYAFAAGQLAVELNAAQNNPIVVLEEDRAISVGNFEILPLAHALDALRLALAPALTSGAERVVKLLETPWSGLPTGLVEEAGSADAGLAYVGIASQAIAAEARLLAHAVSFELASSAHAEGIEDRMTTAPLAARRLAEMVELGARVVANELIVAAQAVDLRDGLERLGRGTARVHAHVRAVVPFVGKGDLVPHDVQPLVDLVRSGALSFDVS